MSTPLKVGGFLLALVALLAVAVGVGRAVGPIGEPATEHATDEHDTDQNDTEQQASDGHADHGAEPSGAAQPAAVPAEIPGGLMVSQNRYTLVLADPRAQAGSDVPVAFTITGPDGEPVTAYDVAHEKRLHLIATRRDHTGFQHVHPELAADGTWTTTLDLTPGSWRLFADFRATGAEALTLGADLAVAGEYDAAAPAPVTTTAELDGYTVTLDGGVVAGKDARLTVTVSKDGEPVTDLQPYLGAYGHLVALREGDLAYLHVHPDGIPGDGSTRSGPDVVFHAAVPSQGRYRLYLDFRHRGVVRTAAFTLATDGAVAAPTAPAPSTGESHDDHTH